MTARFLHARIALFLAALALTAAGCDSNNGKDDSDFAVLQQATWNVTRFSINGTNLTDRLVGDAGEYRSVQLTFYEDPDTNIRRFEIRAQGRNDEANRQASGRVELDASGGILFFDSVTGTISQGFVMNYEILDTTRIDLSTNDGTTNGLALSRLLLPTFATGETPDVRLTIEHSAFAN